MGRDSGVWALITGNRCPQETAMKTVQFLLVHKVSGSWCCRADTALKLYTNMFQVCDGGSHVSRKAAEQDMQTLFV